MLNPIAQLPRYRLAANALAREIEAGAYAAGDRLPPDRELVASLGVSRATVREALIALEIMGYVESRFGAGVTVRDAGHRTPPDEPLPDLAALAGGPFEMLEARAIIEGEIAALAADNITPAALDRLWAFTQAMEDGASEAIWDAAADEEFHATIAAAAGNATLEAIAGNFWTETRNLPMWQHIRDRVDQANVRPRLVAEHERIIEALTQADAPAARRAMQEHLSSFSRELLATWEALPGREQTAVPPPSARFLDTLG